MDYIKQATRSELQDYTQPAYRAGQLARPMHGVQTCVTESGELLDAFKKHIYYGKPLDHTNVREELGDIMWGIAVICDHYGWSLKDIQAANIAKLKRRYPEKFSEDKALVRDLDAERDALG